LSEAVAATTKPSSAPTVDALPSARISSLAAMEPPSFPVATSPVPLPPPPPLLSPPPPTKLDLVERTVHIPAAASNELARPDASNPRRRSAPAAAAASASAESSACRSTCSPRAGAVSEDATASTVPWRSARTPMSFRMAQAGAARAPWQVLALLGG